MKDQLINRRIFLKGTAAVTGALLAGVAPTLSASAQFEGTPQAASPERVTSGEPFLDHTEVQTLLEQAYAAYPDYENLYYRIEFAINSLNGKCEERARNGEQVYHEILPDTPTELPAGSYLAWTSLGNPAHYIRGNVTAIAAGIHEYFMFSANRRYGLVRIATDAPFEVNLPGARIARLAPGLETHPGLVDNGIDLAGSLQPFADGRDTEGAIAWLNGVFNTHYHNLQTKQLHEEGAITFGDDLADPGEWLLWCRLNNSSQTGTNLSTIQSIGALSRGAYGLHRVSLMPGDSITANVPGGRAIKIAQEVTPVPVPPPDGDGYKNYLPYVSS